MPTADSGRRSPRLRRTQKPAAGQEAPTSPDVCWSSTRSALVHRLPCHRAALSPATATQARLVAQDTALAGSDATDWIGSTSCGRVQVRPPNLLTFPL